APSVLCPEIATPPGPVITIENVDSLNLSSYDRDPGTVVRVSCLTTPEYRLVGVSSLTCLDDGTWNSEIPACEPNINNPTMTGTSSGDPADISMVPLIVLVSILGVIFLAFVGVMDPEAVHALSVQEAESAFSERRRTHHPPSDIDRRRATYPPSDCSDNLDSVSTRFPQPQVHTNPHLIHSDHTAFSNSRRPRSSRDFTTTNSLASYDVEPMPSRGHFFDNGGQPPGLKTRIGTRQTYRTWQDLFFSADH
ncbi:hypothetical protein BaRGS_00036770, partial [Batillaria attramentaria]